MALIGWTGHQALNARTAFGQLDSDLVQLQSQLEAGDVQSAAQTLAVAQGHAATALKNTRGLGWWIGTHVPGAGADVTAVRTVAQVGYDTTHQVLPLVIDAGQAVQPSALSPHDGQIDLAPLRQAQANVSLAADLLSTEVDTMAQIDPSALTPSLSAPVTQLQQKLAEAASYADRASIALKLMPGMLGADGPRTYLLIVENNAELRSSGGIAGLYVQITADNGRFTLGGEGTSRTLGMFPDQILPTTPEEDTIFNWPFARYPQNTTQTPDFPRTAQLAQALWQQRTGTQVDGVISADPVALSYILKGTGPIKAADGTTITADNAVSLLLNQTYIDHPDPASPGRLLRLGGQGGLPGPGFRSGEPP